MQLLFVAVAAACFAATVGVFYAIRPNVPVYLVDFYSFMPPARPPLPSFPVRLPLCPILIENHKNLPADCRPAPTRSGQAWCSPGYALLPSLCSTDDEIQLDGTFDAIAPCSSSGVYLFWRLSTYAYTKLPRLGGLLLNYGAAGVQCYNQQMLEFSDKVLDISGVSDNAYLPEGAYVSCNFHIFGQHFCLD